MKKTRRQGQQKMKMKTRLQEFARAQLRDELLVLPAHHGERMEKGTGDEGGSGSLLPRLCLKRSRRSCSLPRSLFAPLQSHTSCLAPTHPLATPVGGTPHLPCRVAAAAAAAAVVVAAAVLRIVVAPRPHYGDEYCPHVTIRQAVKVHFLHDLRAHALCHLHSPLLHALLPSPPCNPFPPSLLPAPFATAAVAG